MHGMEPRAQRQGVGQGVVTPKAAISLQCLPARFGSFDAILVLEQVAHWTRAIRNFHHWLGPLQHGFHGYSVVVPVVADLHGLALELAEPRNERCADVFQAALQGMRLSELRDDEFFNELVGCLGWHLNVLGVELLVVCWFAKPDAEDVDASVPQGQELAVQEYVDARNGH